MIERRFFDTNVLIRALRAGPGDEHCSELWSALVQSKRQILIATPSLAEFLRKSADTIPRTPSRLALYLDLIRWNRPAGWLLLLWPTLAALWIANKTGRFPLPTAPTQPPHRARA